MQRPAGFRIAKDETAWTIFVIRVLFNYVALPGHCILQFRDTYVAKNTLIDGMFGKFVMSLLDLYADLLNQCHDKIISNLLIVVNSPTPMIC